MTIDQDPGAEVTNRVPTSATTDNPGKWIDHTIEIEGSVKRITSASHPHLKTFSVADSSGDVLVIFHDHGLPALTRHASSVLKSGSHVIVTGRVGWTTDRELVIRLTKLVLIEKELEPNIR